MFRKNWKRIMSFVLACALLLQLYPTTAWAEEVLPTDLECEPQSGMSDIYEFVPYDIGTAGTVYLNTYLGSLHLRRDDLSLGGERMPISIEFYFDPINAVSANPYGVGWTTCYNQIITFEQERYAYKNENGTWVYFVNSGELNEDGNEIWTEDTQYGVGETGVELHRPADAAKSDLTSVTIQNGEASYTFDASGRLIKVSDAVNETLIEYVAGAESSIACITDTVGRKYIFEYNNGTLSTIRCEDASGNVITSGGEAIKIQYSVVDGYLTAVTHANGNQISYEYDNLGRLIGATNVDLCGYAFGYSGDSQTVAIVTAKAAMGTEQEETGSITTIERPTSDSAIITSDGVQQKYTFDGCGRIVNCELLTAESSTVTYTADEFACVYGYRLTYGYIQTENGAITNTVVDAQVYDAEGVIGDDATETEPAETEPAETEPEETEPDNYEYTQDAYGNILTETFIENGLRQTTTYTYTEDGNYLTSQTDANGNTVHYQYNLSSGILEYLMDANGNKMVYSYNAIRELQNVHMDVSNLVDASGMDASYSYDRGRLSELNYGDFRYRFTYDIWGNVLCVTMNGAPLVSYDYGTTAYKGEVQALTYGNGQQVAYVYNTLGQVVSVGYTDQPERFLYTYSSDGALESIYDTIMQQTTVYTDSGYEIRSASDEVIYSYSADEEGNGTESVNGLTFQMGITGSGVTVKNGSGNTILSAGKAYDAFSRLANKRLTAGAVQIVRNYTYGTGDDNTGNLVSEYSTYYRNRTSQTTLSFSYSYDGNGNITGITKTERSGMIASINPPVINPITTPVIMSLDSGVSTDAISGDRISLTPVDLLAPNPNYSSSYTYDEAGQLVEAVDGETGTVYRYTYDASGNIRSMYSARVDSEGNETNGITREFYYTDGILTGYGFGSMAHTEIETDAMGNPVKITSGTNLSSNTEPIVKTLTWGEGRMLLGISRDEDNHIAYTYNADGLRSQQVVTKDGVSTTTKYIWGNHGLAAVITDERTVVLLYDDEGEAVGFYVHEEPQPSATLALGRIPIPKQTDFVYTYVKNLQGDVIQIIDEDGDAVVKYTYDPWGVPTVHGDDDLAAINPCSYRGYYYDEETGYYYLQSRYYDPKIGRFINADSQFDENAGFIGNNLYAYCANNPALYKDETGTSITLAIWIGIGIGALIGGLAGWGYAKYFNIPKEKTWKYILGGALIGGIIGGCAGYALSAGSGAVLWSGKGMGEAAAAFAKQNGLKVLEQTLRGKLLSSMAKILPYKIMRPLWEAASARFLLSYAGKQSFVHVFIAAEAYANMKSIFNSVEMQVIADLGLKIIWHFVK